jgi:hypothetical protein
MGIAKMIYLFMMFFLDEPVQAKPKTFLVETKAHKQGIIIDILPT